MKRILSSLFVVLMSVALFAQVEVKDYGKGLKEYRLDNGLTVYLWENHEASDVHGRVVVRAGSIDEPSDYTGLAHYLEHMLFKGNKQIGAIDWEKEEPLYNEIIALYDQLNATTDEATRLELIKKINEKSIEACQYTATDDFSNLTQSYGGDNLNAFTSFDLTVYYNDFPASAMEKWCTLNSDRLIDPVYRSFQAELENVYEEYNMYQDEVGTHQRQAMMDHLFANTPYNHDVIGYQSHLRNPSLSALINFYNTWYVPNNMCLMLVGDFDSQTALPIINKTFGRLVEKPLPERPTSGKTDFSGNQKYTKKIGYNRQLIWAFDAPKMGDDDELAISFALSLLNNGHSTGLLDKLMLDNTVSDAGAYHDARRLCGRIMVIGIPYFDMQNRSYETDRKTEHTIFKEVEKIFDPNQIPDWLFKSVKEQFLQDQKTQFESNDARVNFLTYGFCYNEDLAEEIDQTAAIMALTKEQVATVAKKYLSGDKITLIFEEGEPKKNILPKPQIKPLNPPKESHTPYDDYFASIPTTPVTPTFNDLNDVKVETLSANTTLHYTPNTKNDVFSLTLRYGIGTREKKELGYVASLMSTAGIMPNIDAQQVRRQYSELGATYSFSVTDDYFYITLSGDDKNLKQALDLMTRHLTMPNLDNEQIKAVVSNAYWSRYTEKKNSNTVASALMQYIIYGDKSPYIDRIPMDQLYHYGVDPDGNVIENYILNKEKLTLAMQEVTGYALDIFYCGSLPYEQAASILKGAPAQQYMKDSTSPMYKERKVYNTTNVILLADNKMQQAKIYFYMNGKPFAIEQDVQYDAFNEYFSGGFSGLVMNEIREKRSMAYTAYGMMSAPQFPGKDSYFSGYVGTQSDKVADAIDVFMSLLNDMPSYPERMENIKTFLRQSALASKPSMRTKAQVYEYWRRMGYTEDPAKMNLPMIENLTYEQIEEFYKANVQNQPMTIVIVGDPKKINQKQIKSKYGKITKISVNKLFKGGI